MFIQALPLALAFGLAFLHPVLCAPLDTLNLPGELNCPFNPWTSEYPGGSLAYCKNGGVSCNGETVVETINNGSNCYGCTCKVAKGSISPSTDFKGADGKALPGSHPDQVKSS
ncbi:hypothetical protein XPA_009886 [Xanthoria parietina]